MFDYYNMLIRTNVRNTNRTGEKHMRNRRRTFRHIAAISIILAIGVSICFMAFGTSTQAHSKSQADTYKYYSEICIEQGDTLWDIAKKCSEGSGHSVKETVNEIIKINSLDSDMILEGQYLIVPVYSDELPD